MGPEGVREARGAPPGQSPDPWSGARRVVGRGPQRDHHHHPDSPTPVKVRPAKRWPCEALLVHPWGGGGQSLLGHSKGIRGTRGDARKARGNRIPQGGQKASGVREGEGAERQEPPPGAHQVTSPSLGSGLRSQVAVAQQVSNPGRTASWQPLHSSQTCWGKDLI